MRGLKASLLTLLLTAPLEMVSAANVPADISAAVERGDRPVDAVDMDASRNPVEVLHFLGLKKGARVLDVATGRGYYAEIMARAIGPKGKVLAWEPAGFYDDNEAKVWSELRSRVPNVNLMVTPVSSLTFSPESFDFVLMYLIYHDFYWESAKYHYPRVDPNAVLREIFASLRPGGVVGVIDHVANSGGDTREVVEKLHRIDPAVIRADFERAGFVFDGESYLLRNTDDDHSKVAFDPSIRGKTDRVIHRFRKPG